MGKLYDKRREIERVIRERKLDECETKGKISLKTGFVLNLVYPETPDDLVQLQKLDAAMKEVLG